MDEALREWEEEKVRERAAKEAKEAMAAERAVANRADMEAQIEEMGDEEEDDDT